MLSALCFISCVSALLCSPKVDLMHQGECGLDSFYMESWCQREKIRCRKGLFTYFQLLSFIQLSPISQAGFVWFLFCRVPNLCRASLWTASVLVLKFAGTLVFDFLPFGLGCPWSGTMHKADGPFCWYPKVTLMGWDAIQVKMYPRHHSPPSQCLLRLCLHAQWSQHWELSSVRTAHIAWTSVLCLSQANGASWVQHEAHQSRLCLYCTMHILSPWLGGKHFSRTEPRILITTLPGAWAPHSLCHGDLSSTSPPTPKPVDLWHFACRSLTRWWAVVAMALLQDLISCFNWWLHCPAGRWQRKTLEV